MDKTPQSIQQLIQKEHSTLQGILAKVDQIKRIDLWLKNYLDPKFAKHCHVANLRDDCLILTTSNASVCTQIRLQAPELLIQCRQHPEMRQLKSVQCKISFPLSLAQNKSNSCKPKGLSAETAQCIADTAKSLEDPLRSVLEKIARHRDQDS